MKYLLELFRKKIFEMITIFNFKKHFIAYVFIVLIGFSWFFVTYKKYTNFSYNTGDTAVAEQALWNTIFTHRLFYQSFLVGLKTNLQEHISIIQFLYLPLYAIIPHTLTLFFIIQSFFVASAMILFRFAYAKLGTVGAWLVTLFFLFHPLTLIQVIGPMHVTAIAGPIFLFLLISYYQKYYKLYLFFLLMMMLISEFVAPSIFLLGVLAFFHKRKPKWIFPPIIAGIFLQLIASHYITAGFGSAKNIFSKISLEQIKNIPKFDKRIDFVLKSIAPIGYIFPFFSKYIILIIPSFLIALIIIVYGRINTGAHVFALIPPILVIIFINLAIKWKNTLLQKVLYLVVFIGIIISFLNFLNKISFKTNSYVKQLNEARETIKDDGSLTADAAIGPHVCRRPEFFLPLNKQFTDYVFLKKSKYSHKNNSLNKNKKSYRYLVENDKRYRLVFSEGRIIVYIKKDKIKELLKIDSKELDSLTYENLRKKWNKLAPYKNYNIFRMQSPY